MQYSEGGLSPTFRTPLNVKKRKFEEISEKFDSDSEPEDMDKDDYLPPPSVKRLSMNCQKMLSLLLGGKKNSPFC